MTDPTNDTHIEELLDNLGGGYWPEKHAALTALIAERNKAKADFSDAWRERCEFARRIDEAEGAIFGIVAERDALKQRVAELTGDLNVLVADRSVSMERLAAAKQRIAELEAHPPAASDLRERLVCAALTAIVMAEASYADAAEGAVCYADATLAAMRKGVEHVVAE